jgi:RNA polymerase sigma-70 factor (ECF subfamily)
VTVSPVLSGEAAAFEELEPFRRQLTGYCYRMLASPHDAEDAVQETFIRAWRGLSHLDDRGGLRAWLYRIATNVCLDMLKGRARRALPTSVAPSAHRGEWDTSHGLALGTPRPETTWVQPLPDSLIASADTDPADVVVEQESIRLAFIAAMQELQPRQRAVLILRDVLRWKAEEVAGLLGTSTDAVNSTLRRARATMDQADLDAAPGQPRDLDLELLGRYVEAFERYDVEALVAVLREDATLTMPPFELWLRGIDDITRFLAAMKTEGGRDRVVTLSANGCPALAVYRPRPESGELEAFGIHVLECAGGRIAAIHAFLDPGLFALFGLPLVFQA